MNGDLDRTLGRMQTYGCLANLFMLPFMIIAQLLHWALMLIALPFILIAAIFSRKD